eukprot:comp9038_c0_seq1/m.10294 comp9038_c0_seq1/g.10294  ORF comp9038_c0_seq1/g.10294 comp9038_c0_seq1/m.10294 type:complete len:115 (-) comp9038_c0_seq1:15-359(-)
MGRMFFKVLPSNDTVLQCGSCETDLVGMKSLVSKAFQGRHGRAWLFENVVNVRKGNFEERILMTGLHVVCDIHCDCCDKVLGWFYKEAAEDKEKYKENKFIIEKNLIVMRGKDL